MIKCSTAYGGNASNQKSHLLQCLKLKKKSESRHISSILTYFKGQQAKLPLYSNRSKELTIGSMKCIIKNPRLLSRYDEEEGFHEFLDI